MLPWFTLWFVMTNGSGYIPPMEVRLEDSVIRCGIDGAIVGVQVNKLENPTIVSWPDLYLVDKHCEVDVAARVNELPIGEFHFATTHMGVIGEKPYIEHNPHTSVYWIKSDNPMDVVPRIINLRVQ